jgi:hypothetical protein
MFSRSEIIVTIAVIVSLYYVYTLYYRPAYKTDAPVFDGATDKPEPDDISDEEMKAGMDILAGRDQVPVDIRKKALQTAQHEVRDPILST